MGATIVYATECIELPLIASKGCRSPHERRSLKAWWNTMKSFFTNKTPNSILESRDLKLCHRNWKLQERFYKQWSPELEDRLEVSGGKSSSPTEARFLQFSSITSLYNSCSAWDGSMSTPLNVSRPWNTKQSTTWPWAEFIIWSKMKPES